MHITHWTVVTSPRCGAAVLLRTEQITNGAVLTVTVDSEMQRASQLVVLQDEYPATARIAERAGEQEGRRRLAGPPRGSATTIVIGRPEA